MFLALPLMPPNRMLPLPMMLPISILLQLLLVLILWMQLLMLPNTSLIGLVYTKYVKDEPHIRQTANGRELSGGIIWLARCRRIASITESEESVPNGSYAANVKNNKSRLYSDDSTMPVNVWTDGGCLNRRRMSEPTAVVWTVSGCLNRRV